MENEEYIIDKIDFQQNTIKKWKGQICILVILNRGSFQNKGMLYEEYWNSYKVGEI